MGHNDRTCLTEAHVVDLAKRIRPPGMITHLILTHGLAVSPNATKGQLGQLHLLAHAIMATPELKEVLGLPEDWNIKLSRTHR